MQLKIQLSNRSLNYTPELQIIMYNNELNVCIFERIPFQIRTVFVKFD